MTRATEHPLRRVVESGEGPMILEITSRTIALRPYRSRRGGPAEIVVTHGAIYLRAMMARVDAAQRAKRRARRAK